MTVEPGFGGQKYIDHCTEKIEQLHALLKERKLKVDIQVDGGINEVTTEIVMQAGANLLVAGSNLFAGDLKSNTEGFLKNMKEIQTRLEK
jgi:ribulose-phosphate 3-epimerase